MNTITQAFVLAAGRGTRLRPLTDDLPKPLIPIFQKPLITFALDHLIAAGVQSFVINTHRLPNLFYEFFSGNAYDGHSLTLAHEPDLLETGGGIKNVEGLLGKEPFIVYSGDISTEHWRPVYVKTRDWAESVAQSAHVDPTAQVRGCSVVGPDCSVGAEAVLEDTILWSNAEIASKSQLHGCIVRSRKKVSGIHRNIDI